MLQDLLQQQIPVLAVGKIQDIFAGVPFTQAVHIADNDDGMTQTIRLYQQMEPGVAVCQSGGL